MKSGSRLAHGLGAKLTSHLIMSMQTVEDVHNET